MGFKKATPTLLPGDVYAVYLGKRFGYGLCHLVWYKALWNQASFVLLDHFSPDLPSLDDAKSADYLHFEHPHYEKGIAWLRNLSANRRYDRLYHLGSIPPRPAELALPLGDNWQDSLSRFRTTSWRALDQSLLRELRWRREENYRKEVRARPQPGDLYAFDMPQRNSSVLCRVLKVVGRVESEGYSTRYYLAAYPMQALGSEADPATWKKLKIGGTGNFTSCATTCDSLHESFRYLGTIPTTAEEDAFACDINIIGGWKTVVPYFPEDYPAPKKAVKAPPLRLESIRPETLFSHWSECVDSDERQRARQIIARLASVLRKEKGADPRPAIADAVRAFNSEGSWIETSEREDICDVLVAIGKNPTFDADAIQQCIDKLRSW